MLPLPVADKIEDLTLKGFSNAATVVRKCFLHSDNFTDEIDNFTDNSDNFTDNDMQNWLFWSER